MKHFGVPQWNAVLLVMVIVLATAYFVSVNRTSTSEFRRRALEDRVSAYRSANQELQLTALEYRSLTRIRDAAQAAGMVAIDRLEYLGPQAAGSVAASE